MSMLPNAQRTQGLLERKQAKAARACQNGKKAEGAPSAPASRCL